MLDLIEMKLNYGLALLYILLRLVFFFGSLLGIPGIKIINEDAFEALIITEVQLGKSGVKEPLDNLSDAGSENLYAYI